MPALPKNQFRPKAFDPQLIIFQILSFQFGIYVILSIINLVLGLMQNVPLTLDLLFNHFNYNLSSNLSTFLIINYFLTCIIAIVLLVFIIERVKLCFDFVFTFHFLHLVAVWYYTGYFPKSLVWWLVSIASFLTMTLGGEWACMKWEMKPIEISGSSASGARRSTRNQNSKGYRKLSTSSTLVDNDIESSTLAINDDTIELTPLNTGHP